MMKFLAVDRFWVLIAVIALPSLAWAHPLGPPINLSDSAERSSDPALVRSDGKVHVVWTEVTEPTLGEIFYRRGTGESFADAVNLSESPTLDSEFAQVAAIGRHVYVVWLETDLADESLSVFFRASHDQGRTFEPAIRIDEPGTAGVPRLAAAENAVYVAWRFEENGDERLFFVASHDRGESFDDQLRIDNGRGVGDLALAAGDNFVYLLWANTTDEPSRADLFFRRSSNEGRSFRPIRVFSEDPNIESSNPAMVADDDEVFIAWRDCVAFTDECDIKFRRSLNGGSTFSSERNLSDNPGFSDSPQIGVSEGKVFVTWSDLTSGRFEVLLRASCNDGKSFGSTLTLSESPGDAFLPKIAADDGRGHVVWVDLVGGEFEIFGRTVHDACKGKLGPLVNVSNFPGVSLDPQIDAEDGEIDIAWFEPSIDEGEILYRLGENKIR